MTEQIKIICEFGHEHEIEKPGDLIRIADASRLSGRTIQTIMTHIRTRRILGYKISDKWGNNHTYVSQKQIENLYSVHDKAS